MISKTYNPREIEDKWYSYWIENRYFNSKPNPEKEPYTVVIPPPNVTGVLHMGHMLNNTIQDVLVRKARMEGKEACWVPGTDHASIATEAKVVAMLKEQGIQKSDLTREEFYKYAWEWTDKYGGIILQQLRKLGASCDWDRTRFTMEPSLYDAVIDTFIDLYNKGYIYRGHRMVNWDPQAKTTVSDEEVITKEVMTKLCYLKYPIVGSDESIMIATVRPETIMADSAICVHPEDERYIHLHGKKALIPLINREIPIITDEYVTMDFGTGALKVTPAHDQNDYDLGIKHKLEIIDILTEDGKLNEKARILIGEDRFVARKKIIKMLEESGNLEKVEDYKSNVGHSERTNAVIEPRLSLQWFVSMKELCKPALENVMNDNIQLHPAKFKNTYRIWIENIAGLRLGFGVANPSLLSGLFKVKDSYNIDAVAIAVGTAAMRDRDYKNANAEKVKISRTKLTQDLKNIGFAVPESHGNFVLVTPPQGNAEQIYLKLKESDILVRYFNQAGLADKLRITVGTDEQNQALIDFLSTL
jgi:valyl-tRNA synthetase